MARTDFSRNVFTPFVSYKSSKTKNLWFNYLKTIKKKNILKLLTLKRSGKLSIFGMPSNMTQNIGRYMV